MIRRIKGDESGLTKLETLGLIAFVVAILSMVSPIRVFVVDLIGIVFGQMDPETGHPNEFSTFTRGVAIAGGAVLVFIGSGWFLLWTNLGKRLSFLLTGAATFGWLVINGILFVVYAPRGIRPENLEGLTSMQTRLPAIAMTAGSFVLLLMFLIALNRYESDES